MAYHNSTCGCPECRNYGQAFNPGAIHNQSCGCDTCGNYPQRSQVQSTVSTSSAFSAMPPASKDKQVISENSKRIVIYELARELKLESKKIIDDARRMGVDVSVPSNTLDDVIANKIRELYFPSRKNQDLSEPEKPSI